MGDAEAARDIGQTVFLTAFRQIRSLRNVRSFRPWLFRIAVNEATDFLRRTIRERVMVMPVEQVEVVQATLGDNAGVIGAALWAANKFSK